MNEIYIIFQCSIFVYIKSYIAFQYLLLKQYKYLKMYK